jgi:hypothetical protein
MKPQPITTYDLTPTLRGDLSQRAIAEQAWDEAHAITTLQGIVNRSAPRLYLRFVEHEGRNIDDYWLEHLSATGMWLADRPRQMLATLEAAITHYRDEINGAVIYDPDLPATSNLASTLAGLENLIAIRFDPSPGSIYTRLITHGPQLPIRYRLHGEDFRQQIRAAASGLSAKSDKCAAYVWAVKEFIETGRCDPTVLAYYIDHFWTQFAKHGPANHHTVTNHDYFIARQAFFCDLHCWDDETPNDNPDQPLGADRETLLTILASLYKQNAGQILHIGGFTPWAYKYTDFPGVGNKHHGVHTEWELVRIVSAYNGFIDADAIGFGAMANASFFMHYPLDTCYPQAEPTDPAALDPDGDRDFVVFYVGDYDSAAWLYQRMPDLWNDPKRGQLPLSWAISPILAVRAPHVMAHLWNTRSENDTFWSGDNGAGYLNPTMLVEPRPISGLPNGLDAWIEHCAKHYAQWSLDSTGFIIDGFAQQMHDLVYDAYARFSPVGVVPQYAELDAWMHKQMPVLKRGPDIGGDDPAKAADEMLTEIKARRERGLRFHWFRSILKSPSWHAAAVETLRAEDPRITIINANELFARLKRSLIA